MGGGVPPQLLSLNPPLLSLIISLNRIKTRHYGYILFISFDYKMSIQI